MEKLLFFTNSFQTGNGGVASYAQDFVHAFCNLYEIIVVTNDGYIKNEQSDNFEVQHLNLWDFSCANALNTIRYINELSPKIVVNSFAPLLSLITPYIDDNISLLTVSHLTNEKLGYIAGYNLDYIDNVIVLSSFAKKYILTKFGGKNTNKVHIVYNFMSPLSLDKLNKKKTRPLKIVFPGGAASHKSPAVVCKALLRLLKTDYDFDFYWLGNTKLAGSKFCFIRIKNIADLLPKDNRIKHVGGVDREKAKKIISEANLFLLPSKREGFPIALIEAMRAGCIPIISDAHHGSLDIIENCYNGLITKQGDDKCLYKCIIEVLEHHDNYYDIYENSYKTYADKLSYTKWIESMKEIVTKESHNHKIRYTKFSKFSYSLERFCFSLSLYIDVLLNYKRQLVLFVEYRWINYIFKKLL